GQRQFERLQGLPWQTDELQELHVLAPDVGLAVRLGVLARLSPAGDRGEAVAGRRRAMPVCGNAGAGRPPIEDDGLSRRAVVEALDRDPAVRCPEVLAEGEMVRMGAEQVDGAPSSLLHLDLGEYRVRL